MVIKLLTIDLLFPGCSSLKEKRFALSSLKAKMRQKYNVSVAEVGYHEKWQRSCLAVVMVGVDRKTVDRSCDKVLRFVEDDHRIQITDVQREIC